jgi:hypothetical protein
VKLVVVVVLVMESRSLWTPLVCKKNTNADLLSKEWYLFNQRNAVSQVVE